MARPADNQDAVGPDEAKDRVLELLGEVRENPPDSLEPILPLLFNLNGKPYTLRNHFPFSPVFRTRIPRKRISKTGRQVSKCLSVAMSDVVRLADGRQVSPCELKVGDSLLSLGYDFKFIAKPIVRIHETGQKPVYTVKTRLGAEFSVTAAHRLRTLYGYTAVSDLVVGSRLASVGHGGVFHDIPVDKNRIVFTACMLGDGCNCSQNFSSTSATPAGLSELEAICVTECGKSPRARTKAVTTAITYCFPRVGRLADWFRADELFGKRAWEKSIPAWVFRLSRANTALFISRLWATDGMIGIGDDGCPDIAYSSTSRRLSQGLRSLLNKLGIIASLSQRTTSCKGERCRDTYVVRVETRPSQSTFLSEIVVPGKPAVPIPVADSNNNRDTIPSEISATIRRLAADKYRQRGETAHRDGLSVSTKYALSRRRLDEYIEYFGTIAAPGDADMAFLRSLQAGGVVWDAIEAIEPAGEQTTLDIEVLDTHNYVLDGVVSHNSTSMAASGLTISLTNPHFTTLFITPLFEQIRRFSSNYVAPFIAQSPIRPLMVDTSCDQSVLQRTFLNYSKMIFSYAFLDANRVRGVTSCRCCIDEFQDMSLGHLPIIAETMSHAPHPWGITDYTGTPKGHDNPMERYWQSSSQAEWVIKCRTGGCNHYNFCASEFDLLKMLGKVRDDISADNPALVCSKCRKPLDPPSGFWLHRNKDRRWDFPGYHVPQAIMPIHYGDPEKWAQLLAKWAGENGTSPHVFFNEVLGESYDVGSKLVTESELKAASSLPIDNTPNDIRDEITRRRSKYLTTVLAIDWGGGGGEMMSGRSEAGRRQRVSFTSLAYLGFRPDGKVDCLWGRRLLTPNDHIGEAEQVMAAIKTLNPHLLAHDFTGAGALRETLLVERRFPAEKIVGVAYAHAPARSIMIYVPPDRDGDVRPHYRVDKTRTMLTTVACIKSGILRFFRHDFKSADNPGLINDFLSLTEEKVERASSADLYIIRRLAAFPDDFANAVNVGLCALFHRHGWPDFSAHMKVSPDSLDPGNWQEST